MRRGAWRADEHSAHSASGLVQREVAGRLRGTEAAKARHTVAKTGGMVHACPLNEDGDERIGGAAHEVLS